MFGYKIIQSLNELEILVYNYIMKHKEEVKYMTIRELSEAVHVSTSTILRFCKKCGCDGYSEFRIKYKMYLQEEGKKPAVNGLDEIMHFFQSTQTDEFKKTLKDIEMIVEEAESVIFIGIGTSGILGKYGARYFSNLDKFSQCIEDPYYPIGSDRKNTVVIALSVSGERREVIELVERFRGSNCKIISITNKSACTLAKLSDFNLPYYVAEELVKGEYNVTTQVPVLYILETIGRSLQKEQNLR